VRRAERFSVTIACGNNRRRASIGPELRCPTDIARPYSRPCQRCSSQAILMRPRHCGLPNMWRAGLRIAPRLYSEDADTPSGAAVWGRYTSSSCVEVPRVSSKHHLARLCRGRRSRRNRRNPAKGRSHRGRPRSRLALRRVLGPLSVSLLVRASTSHLSLMRWFVTAVITGPYRGCIECAQGGLSNVRNRGA